MDRPDDKLLTMPELMRHLGLKDSAFKVKMRKGELPPPIWIGGSKRWRLGRVLEWVRAVEIVSEMTPALLSKRGQKPDEKRSESVENRHKPADEDLGASGPKKSR